MATDLKAPAAARAERERVLRILREEAPRLRARGITTLSLFGSIARGEAVPKSDIDLLIETDPQGPARLLRAVRAEGRARSAPGAAGAIRLRPRDAAVASGVDRGRPDRDLLLADKTVRLRRQRPR
ncbi:MAG TPA: nucleotidyltransferase domain-containing protein [Geminicoccaceae bacterium]|nr:nucleotidyltransferase domain-containing protein [Geminicoccaceae bacterium]